MSLTVRSNPHLRLTAAILVAMLAALSGSVDGDGGDRLVRGRRSEVQTLIGGIRLVSIPDDAPARAHLAAAIDAVRKTEGRESVLCPLTADRAESRALRTLRHASSRASGPALLRTTALPPPIA